MCLGVPGKVTDIYTVSGLRMGKVDFGGVIREACLESLPELQIGDYTIVHAGFALNKLSEEEAKETLDALQELALIEEELSRQEGGARQVGTISFGLSTGSAPNQEQSS